MAISKKWIIVAAAVGAVSAGGALGAYFAFREASIPDPTKQTPEQIVKYMASDDFGELSKQRKEDYFQKVRQQQREDAGPLRESRELSPEERKNLRENVAPLFRKMMEERVERYFELPPEQRTGHLDEIIDRMQGMRSQRQQERPGDASGDSRSRRSGPHGRGFTPERLRRLIETTDPKKRALFAEFHKALLDRMKQRGMNFGPGSRR